MDMMSVIHNLPHEISTSSQDTLCFLELLRNQAYSSHPTQNILDLLLGSGYVWEVWGSLLADGKHLGACGKQLRVAIHSVKGTLGVSGEVCR